ncbi:hypothetical protein [Pedobacter africanus]|uniref:Uncharacterized protein n=1 Tax=Pedobacter africanus TaxID=151894 RepID=A0A1W2EF82_9SPHI|nr:hypothetical protein [Pedobacter africanus]SMD08325.1 hypothetical protein SAMN04488524_4752 [Pedobacter africanus]
MKRLLLLVFLTTYNLAKSQTLQSVYDNGRFIQTAPSMPVVIKAGADAHGLQIWGRPDGYGYIEFFNELGGGPQRAIFGYESRLNYEAPAHNFIGNIGIGILIRLQRLASKM